MDESLTAEDFMSKWEEAMRIRGFNHGMESDNAFMEKWIRAVKNINRYYTDEQMLGLGPSLKRFKDDLENQLVEQQKEQTEEEDKLILRERHML